MKSPGTALCVEAGGVWLGSQVSSARRAHWRHLEHTGLQVRPETLGTDHACPCCWQTSRT